VWYKQTVQGLQEMTQKPASDVEIYDDLSSKFSVVKGKNKHKHTELEYNTVIIFSSNTLHILKSFSNN
jgi:hypothetical protein